VSKIERSADVSEAHRLEKEFLSCTGKELTVWGDALNWIGIGKHLM
jgi:hypothetical protein